MVADYKLKDYFLEYTCDCKNKILECENDIIKIKERVDILHNFLKNNEDRFVSIFNLNLKDYDIEYNKILYNEDKLLYNTVLKLIKKSTSDNKNLLIQVLKYLNLLSQINIKEHEIELNKIKQTLNFKEYSKYVKMYYNAMHKLILKGYAYKFKGGIGNFVIGCFKLEDKNIGKQLDFAATNKRKQELIAKGIKLYNKDEAEICKAQGIPYDGVDYKVYKQNNQFYDFIFDKHTIFSRGEIEYQRAEYVDKPLRGMSYKEMADKYCKTLDDIANMNVDIRYKLNMYLYQNPQNYLDFIRNDKQKICSY